MSINKFIDYLISKFLFKIPYVKNVVESGGKGKFSWTVDVLELIFVIAYLIIGYNGIMNNAMSGNISGMFNAVNTAIWFLVIATIILSVMCFLPPFTSNGNRRMAVWNIIWIIFSIYALVS